VRDGKNGLKRRTTYSMGKATATGGLMYRRILVLLLVCSAGVPAVAQDLSNIQIHGFVTQGLLYSSHNNYFTANTTNGSVQWTDGAISVSDSITDKLRVGIQLHMYELGQLGGPHLDVDWVSGDYRVKPWLGFRAGKVKTRVGLFNDSQDVDAVHLWALLPESMYQTDNKSFLLSHYGFDVYGTMNLGENGGKFLYTGYAGYRDLDLHGGYINTLRQAPLSLEFPTAPSGSIYGGDTRWQTPLRGLTLGLSASVSNLKGTALTGGINAPASLLLGYYGQYEKGKFYAAAEYRKNPIVGTIPTTFFTVPFSLDQRSWYVMTSYRVAAKLQVGTYYSHYVDKSKDTTLPANYSKDWTLSGRYDFNQYFYAKVEGHFVHGTALNFYAINNPAGDKTTSKLLAVKAGFTF
jgi:hypothetical protein